MSTTQHPGWCVGDTGGCTGRWHQSAAVTIPENEASDLHVSAALRQSQRGQRFVELMVGTVYDDIAGKSPSDPVYVTDPHAHDLTVDQAEVLHGALGELLALARAGQAGPEAA